MKQKFFAVFCFVMMFVTVLGSSVFAAEFNGLTIPSTWDLDDPKATYVFYKSIDGTIKCVNSSTTRPNATANDEDIKYTLNGSNLVMEVSYSSTSVVYSYDEATQYWSKINNTNVSVMAGSARTVVNDFSEFIGTNTKIYDTNGDLVFPQPPMTALEKAVLEGITGLQTKTLTTMQTLALCGVGCLALLIGLALLPKILYKFL